MMPLDILGSYQIVGIFKKIAYGVILIIAGTIALDTYSYISHNQKHNVLIETKTESGYSIGSGVLISKDGLVVTAEHCVDDIEHIRITLQDGRIFEDVYIYSDPNTDVSIINLATDVNEFAIIGDSNNVEKWDFIYSVGNSWGLWKNVINFGYVYENPFKRMFMEDEILIFAQIGIVPGCSGGGVYKRNRLVGIISRSFDYGESLIVPSNTIKKILEDYEKRI